MATILRRYWAALLVAILGVAAIVGGIGTATWWRPSGIESAALAQDTASNVVITRQGVLDLYTAPLTVDVKGEDGTVVAIGRATDVAAWVDGLAYTRVDGINADGTLKTGTVDGNGTTEASSPAGSDMWVDEASVEGGEATLSWSARDDGQYAVLAYSPSGTPELTLNWAVGVKTPWLWPLVALGVVLLLVAGGLAYVLLRRAKATGAQPRQEHAPATDAAVPTEEEHAPERDEPTAEEGPSAEPDGWAEASEDEYVPTFEAAPDFYAGAFVMSEEADPVHTEGSAAPENGPALDAVSDEPHTATWAEDDYFDALPARDGEPEPEGGDDIGQTWADRWAPPEREARHGDEPASSASTPTDMGPGAPVIPAPPAAPPRTMPTRREMREARKRGKAVIEIDGVKFPTGLIPVVDGAILPVSDSEEGASSADFGGQSAFSDPEEDR